jgi:putative transposase
MYIEVVGVQHHLWRAVDQDGVVLDILVQPGRDAKAAEREILAGVEYRQHKSLNNHAGNSHQPIRRRERITERFTSPRQVQRFLSIHDQIASVFSRRSDQDTAAKFRVARSRAFNTRAEAISIVMAV